MSSKLTIASSDDYHLYNLAFDDKGKIYLQINNCSELDIKTNFYGPSQEKQVTVSVPLSVWHDIIDSWVDKDG